PIRIACCDGWGYFLPGGESNRSTRAQCSEQNTVPEVPRGDNEAIVYLPEVWQIIRGPGASPTCGFHKVGFFQTRDNTNGISHNLMDSSRPRLRPISSAGCADGHGAVGARDEIDSPVVDKPPNHASG